MSSSALDEYLWIVILGGIFGFLYAFWIGANDVANAFASTVAAKSLTLGQAVMVAAVFEFCGALFLGSSVTSTIRSKIFDTTLYKYEPDIVFLGMFTSLIAGTAMLMVATIYGLPVSTTHTIVGAIMGFSIVAKGFDSINWTEGKKIFISWVVSPLVSGAVSFLFFGAIRIFILGSDNAYQRAYYTFPLILTCGIGIDLFYILYKGINNKVGGLKLSHVLPIAFGVGAFCGILWIVVFGPIVKKLIAKKKASIEQARLEAKGLDEEAGDDDEEEEGPERAAAKKTGGNDDDDEEEGAATSKADMVAKNEEAEIDTTTDRLAFDDDVIVSNDQQGETTPATQTKSVFRKLTSAIVDNTVGQDLQHQSFHENKRAEDIWDKAVWYDDDAELMFGYIQVFTACLNSFAHGANDVANAIAPLSAMIQIYQDGVLKPKSNVQTWVLAYGGIGIVVGLFTYGYQVMKSIGFKLTALSPSRGASAELAASLFVVTASFLSIPVSSTQAIVGAVAGVGLVNGFGNVQWLFLARVCVSWVFVFVISVILSAGCFSFLTFTPKLGDSYADAIAFIKANFTNYTNILNYTNYTNIQKAILNATNGTSN